jgi:UDP-N-acetylglucosamine--N-acetylmuramyl-(pentapeptide) pyrophosphoryl-undecaprenol N-acetylglucosamine transferase
MKILFTGGGTGGHFYPIIAVAEAITKRVQERKILPPTLYYMAPTEYNSRALFEAELKFIQVPAGKIRRYFSLLNITDAFKTAYGCVMALISMFRIYPDVVFAKGGYASFPALLAAKILHIPVIIHESDSKPGRVNAWAGKFAKKIAVSYPEAASYFKGGHVAHTGNPIRAAIIEPMTQGAREFLNLEEGTPVVLVLGGSQGSQNINDIMLNTLPELLNRFQVIHQVGKANIAATIQTTNLILKDHPHKHRYHPFDYLNDLAMRMSAGVADVIVSRAGSTIFEIASWGKPSIIIPLNPEVSHDQTTNARAYAKSGAASVIEENNLTAHVLIGEIDRINSHENIKSTMVDRAKAFARKDSATLIADAILNIALEHEN